MLLARLVWSCLVRLFVCAAVVMAIESVTAADADLQCYKCAGSGAESQCVTSPQLIANSIITCKVNESCATVVSFYTMNNAVRTIDRGCQSIEQQLVAANCCRSLGDGLAECTTTCDNDLCNSEVYNSTTTLLDDLPRCPKPGNKTHMMCLWCQTTTPNCVSKPDTVYVSDIMCNRATQYCTVQHQVYTIDPTTIYSYQRSCLPIGSQKYGRTYDSQFITWICHCSSDYCNDNTEMGTTEECHPRPTINPPIAAAISHPGKLISFISPLLVVAFVR